MHTLEPPQWYVAPSTVLSEIHAMRKHVFERACVRIPPNNIALYWGPNRMGVGTS